MKFRNAFSVVMSFIHSMANTMDSLVCYSYIYIHSLKFEIVHVLTIIIVLPYLLAIECLKANYLRSYFNIQCTNYLFIIALVFFLFFFHFVFFICSIQLIDSQRASERAKNNIAEICIEFSTIKFRLLRCEIKLVFSPLLYRK